jgi:hypothetical protein
MEIIKHYIISTIIYLKNYFSTIVEIDTYSIPIIINNFNKLDSLKKLLHGLQSRGYYNIIVLDNKSTFPPLLDFYSKSDIEVIFLNENYGFRALWQSGIYERFKKNYFVYTDPDLEIINECPKNFLSHFKTQLTKNKLCSKVGFSLKIDDLPDASPFKEEVLIWETKYYSKPTVDKLFFRAPIDTTFALYKPYSFKHIRSPHAKIFRSAFPYQIRHLPWYITKDNRRRPVLFKDNELQ